MLRPGETIVLSSLVRGTMLQFNDVYIDFKKEKTAKSMRTKCAIVLTTVSHLGPSGTTEPKVWNHEQVLCSTTGPTAHTLRHSQRTSPSAGHGWLL